MPHHKFVTRNKVKDNPEKAPEYPGRFSRNNQGGVTMSRDKFLQDQTNKWVRHMSDKQEYKKTYMADKALVLLSHLSKTLTKGHRMGGHVRQDNIFLCRKLIITSEARLRQEGKARQEGEVMLEGVVNIDGDISQEGEMSQEMEVPKLTTVMMEQVQDKLDNISGGPIEELQRGTRREVLGELRDEVLGELRDEVLEGQWEEVLGGQGYEKEGSSHVIVEESTSEDIEWTPTVKRKMRSVEEFELAKLLEESDEEIFGGGNDEKVNKYKSNKLLRSRKELFGEKYLSSKRDKELFEKNTTINKYVLQTKAFKERASNYSVRFYQENYEDYLSDDILASLPETSEIVKKSNIVKERFRHLMRKEKSDKVKINEEKIS